MELRSDQDIVPIQVDRDRGLVELLRRGEPTAVEHLVAAYCDRAYRLAARITLSEQDAEEAVQDAFWAVVHKIDTFRGDAAFGSWFYRIVANAAYQKVRMVRRRAEIFLDDVLPAFDEHGAHAAPLEDWSPRIGDPARQCDVRRALTSGLDLLSGRDRAAVILRDVDGWSIAQIAETLGLSVPNAKIRVHRARLFLRKRLGESLGAA